MKEFSVIVLLYQSDPTALKETLHSIILQQETDYEIILADDASRNACLSQAVQYLEQQGVTDFKVCEHRENVGTVQNISDALELAEGKYVKCIGAGDMLFAEHTLRDIFRFMEQQSGTMCFGMLQGYYRQEGKLIGRDVYDPVDIQAFLSQRQRRIKNNIIHNHGLIVGAGMFYNTEKFKAYLKEIVGVVRYCEDFLQILLLVKGEQILFYSHGAVYYEVGTGISTDGSTGSSERIQRDHIRFWEMLSERYGQDPLVKKGYRMHRLEMIPDASRRRPQILCKNPGYAVMHFRTKFEKKRYHVEEKGYLNIET